MKEKEFKDYKSIKDKVRFLLRTNELLRDNDNKLIATYHHNELGKDRIAEMTATEYLTEFAFGRLTKCETITRERKKIQAMFESLRGSQYKVRVKKKEDWFI
ncbi:MAG: hypothetical protein WCJ62_12550, partial [Flavobacterium sp.]